MKHEYEDIVNILTLPETIAQTLYYSLGEVKHQVTIIGFVRLSLGVSECWFSPFDPRIKNDLDFLIMHLFRADSGHGKVFKDIQVLFHAYPPTY